MYRQATYGKTRADVTWRQLCSQKYSKAEAVTPSLWRGPIESSSSQPCCKHHYFTPPSLSLLLLFCREDDSKPATMRPFQAKKGDKKKKKKLFQRPDLSGRESSGVARSGKCKSSAQNHTVKQKKRGTTNVAKVCAVYRNAAWGPLRAKQRQHSQWLSLPSATTSAHH